MINLHADVIQLFEDASFLGRAERYPTRHGWRYFRRATACPLCGLIEASHRRLGCRPPRPIPWRIEIRVEGNKPTGLEQWIQKKRDERHRYEAKKRSQNNATA
jgi:hypothetical protein